MACKDCTLFETYKSKGGLPQWFDFGFCNHLGKTKGDNDLCEVDHREPLRFVSLREGGDSEYTI